MIKPNTARQILQFRSSSTEPTPFGDNARQLSKVGLCPIPCGGEENKTPIGIKWKNLSKRPGKDFLSKLIEKHSTANIGILTGKLSGVTIVDIDDPEIVDAMQDRFGDTLIVTSTPSGGVHLWYRWTDERSRNLRSEGLKVDIKATGGFIVVPPSFRPSTGVPYRLIKGSFADLGNLQPIKPNSLEERPTAVVGLRGIGKGRRNNTIFLRLLREVKHTDDIEALLDVAQMINSDHTEEPLPDSEILGIVRSVWSIEVRGENWVGQDVQIPVSSSEIDLLSPHPNALTFWVSVIRRHHWDRTRGPFALASKAMAENEVIKGWKDRRRYHSSIENLIKLGFLKRAHNGKKKGDPSKYLWILPSDEKGTH